MKTYPNTNAGQLQSAYDNNLKFPFGGRVAEIARFMGWGWHRTNKAMEALGWR